MKERRSLEQSIYQMEQFYIMLYAISQKILKENSVDSEETCVPIKKLAELSGIDIYTQKLSRIDDKFLDERIGILTNYSIEWRINLNNECGALTQRYAIAYEFANYSLIKMQEEVKNRSCSRVLFPIDGLGTTCDTLALFLLLPFCSVVKLMKKFVEKCISWHELGEVEEWIHYLANEAGLTDYYTVIGYQNIRTLAGALMHYVRDADFKEETDKLIEGLGINLDDEITMIRENRNFFI